MSPYGRLKDHLILVIKASVLYIVYEELNESKKIGEDNKEEFKIPEGITVNLNSSAEIVKLL
jgi:hypothetical protein